MGAVPASSWQRVTGVMCHNRGSTVVQLNTLWFVDVLTLLQYGDCISKTDPPPPPPFLRTQIMKAHLRKTVDTRCNAAKAKTTHSTTTRQAQGNADAGAGKLKQEEEEASEPPRKDVSVGQGGGDGNDNADVPPRKPSPSVEVVLARLLTDTLASLTREFEEEALEIGEVRCKNCPSCCTY